MTCHLKWPSLNLKMNLTNIHISLLLWIEIQGGGRWCPIVGGSGAQLGGSASQHVHSRVQTRCHMCQRGLDPNTSIHLLLTMECGLYIECWAYHGHNPHPHLAIKGAP
jgi:hypothetical protein